MKLIGVVVLWLYGIVAILC